MTDQHPADPASTQPLHPTSGAVRLKKIILALIVILAGIGAALAIAIATQPAEFHVERSAKFTAPPAEVFAQVNDFHHWDNWSPWAKIDPNMKQSFDGPEAGEGAVYSWTGNNDVGEGKMTIVESRPNELVKINLEFKKPMESTCLSQFALKPSGDGTELIWSMDGENNFIGKAMGLIMDIDGMVGEQFDEGLANLKSVVEKKSDQ